MIITFSQVSQSANDHNIWRQPWNK